MKILLFIIGFIILQKDSKRFELVLDAAIKLPAHVKIMKRIKLTDEQVNIADRLINVYLNENQDKYTAPLKSDNYYRYYRQFIGYLSDETKNTVFVNAFNERSEYMTDDFLKKKLAFAFGGGSGFFTIKVNLKEMICYDLSVNAPK